MTEIVPDSVIGVATLLALVIPGIVYAAVRTSLRGYQAADRSVSSRLVQAMMVSVALDAFYLVAFGRLLTDVWTDLRDYAAAHPEIVGLSVLLLGVVIPALVAYLIHGQSRAVDSIRGGVENVLSRTAVAGVVRSIRPRAQYRKAPTAWDWIAHQQANTWVRVLTGKGNWVGGEFTEDAFLSSYPEPRDLYIPIQWVMDETGGFARRVEGGSGVWLSLEGAQVVEWLAKDADPTEGGSG